MAHFFATLLAWAQVHGLKGVFVFMVIENLGVPFPTEAGFIAAQGIINAAHGHHSHHVAYWTAFLYIFLGHLTGAGIGYCAGRAGDNVVARRLSHSRRMMKAREITHRWYGKYGALTVLFGRLVGQVRPWASFLAGASKVPPLTYWTWTVIGTLIYTPIAMWMTAWGWAFWMRCPQLRVPTVIVVLTVFYGAVVYAFIVNWVKRRRARRRGTPAEASADEAQQQSEDATTG